MSLFSRLFRKAPSPSSPTSAARPPEKADAAASAPSAAERALAAAAEERALQAAIEAGDVPAIARLVVAGTSTKLRQAAAQAIDDPELLRQLIREVRGGNDKSVYKILTSKRDAQAEQARKLEQLRAEIDAAAAALERHSQREHDALYAQRLDQMERRWAAVAAQADAERAESVRQWIERARETVAAHQREAAARAAREQAAAEAAEQQRLQREQEAQAAAASAAEQARLIEEQRRAQAAQQQAAQQALREIGELIRKAHAALGEGSTARATALRKTVEDRLDGAPPLPAELASQLQHFDLQLRELKDWKSFSVAPKRAELIEQMESLIGAELEPPALAEKIKRLQDEWRSLSKGGGENLEADWQRFHAASQKAYQPCSEYFAAQALVREENLKRREALIERLAAFEAAQNWEQPDWRAVIATLRDIKQEWRGHSPVERKAGKAQQERFDALAAGLQGRLDAEYARNLKQKESLIERARQALALEDGRKATDTVKQLQQQWQAVGPVPREADQRLWAEFRKQCDAVFVKRQQASVAHAAGLEDNKAQAIALCEQVEQIAALEGVELVARAATLGDLRNRYASIGELPRAETRALRQRFDQALERCDAALSRQRAREAERAWDALFDSADRVRACRLAVARGADAPQVDALKQAAESGMASVPRWPKGGLEALEQALAAAPSSDLAANETELRRLCVRAEIATDTPTPPEDQALRREYQLQRLVQGMGERLRTDATQLDALAIEWVRVGPVEDAVYQALVQRFRRCRARGGRGS